MGTILGAYHDVDSFPLRRFSVRSDLRGNGYLLSSYLGERKNEVERLAEFAEADDIFFWADD